LVRESENALQEISHNEGFDVSMLQNHPTKDAKAVRNHTKQRKKKTMLTRVSGNSNR
jgi:hypothetical protein